MRGERRRKEGRRKRGEGRGGEGGGEYLCLSDCGRGLRGRAHA